MKTTITLTILAIMALPLIASAACGAEIDALTTQGNAVARMQVALEERVAALETNAADSDARDERLLQSVEQLVQAEAAKIQVPAGPQGERGEQGPQGERGEQGPQGALGERGPQGDRGEQGAQGVQGPQGERGQQGERGERGEQGPQGAQGDRGEQGPQGSQGVQGPQGERGEQGLPGERGEQGPQGVFVAPADLRAERIILGKDGAVLVLKGGADGKAASIVWYYDMDDFEKDLPDGRISVGTAIGEVAISHWDGNKYIRTCLNRGSWRSCPQ